MLMDRNFWPYMIYPVFQISWFPWWACYSQHKQWTWTWDGRDL